ERRGAGSLRRRAARPPFDQASDWLGLPALIQAAMPIRAVPDPAALAAAVSEPTIWPNPEPGVPFIPFPPEPTGGPAEPTTVLSGGPPSPQDAPPVAPPPPRPPPRTPARGSPV